MAEFRMEKRNKLRRIFNPTPEERTEQLARMKKIFERQQSPNKVSSNGE